MENHENEKYIYLEWNGESREMDYTSVTLTKNLVGFSLGIVAWELEFGNSIGTLACEL